jgi:ATP/ADP translocase
VSKRRDNLLFLGGLLIGLGIGLLFGLLLLIWAISLLMHHMFIMGVQASSIGFLTVFVVIPLSLVIAGLVTRRKASRPEYE